MYYEMLKARRSIRKFEEKDVEKEKLDTILKSALLSPSSRAIRPWEFIVVTDKTLLQKLSGCREHSAQFLSGAAVGIVVIADPSLSDVWVEDASIASVNIQLSAQSLGLGSCWVQVRQRQYDDKQSAGDYIKKVLTIPEKYSVESIIAIGYAAEEKAPHDENRLLYAKLHYNGF